MVAVLPTEAIIGYVVPGADFFAQFVALFFLALTALGSALMYPIYSLLKYLRSRRAAPTETTLPAPTPEQPQP